MLQVLDFIVFFTASFVIDLSHAKPGAAWRHFTAYLFTKLSTYFVGDKHPTGQGFNNAQARGKTGAWAIIAKPFYLRGV
jgi:hypothetical protein